MRVARAGSRALLRGLMSRGKRAYPRMTLGQVLHSRASPRVSARRRRIGGENGGRQADEPVCSKHEWEPKLPPTFLWFKPEQLIELTLELHKRGPDQSFSLLILRGFGDDVLGRD